jgi:hypothetical protein
MAIPQARTGTEDMYHGELHPSHDKAASIQRRETPDTSPHGQAKDLCLNDRSLKCSTEL